MSEYFDERLFGEFALFKSGESTGMEICSNLVGITQQFNFDRFGRTKQSGGSKQSKGFSFADVLIAAAGAADVSALSNMVIF